MKCYKALETPKTFNKFYLNYGFKKECGDKSSQRCTQMRIQSQQVSVGEISNKKKCTKTTCMKIQKKSKIKCCMRLQDISTRSLPLKIRVWLARPLSVVLKCPIGRIDLFRGVSDQGAAKTISGAREQGTASHRLYSRVTVCSFVSSFRQMCPNKTDQPSEKITDHLYYPQLPLKATV